MNWKMIIIVLYYFPFAHIYLFISVFFVVVFLLHFFAHFYMQMEGGDCHSKCVIGVNYLPIRCDVAPSDGIKLAL